MRNAFFAALALLVATPAFPDSLAPRDLEVLPDPSGIADVSLSAWFDRAEPIYALGEAVRLFVRSSGDGYVTAFAIGPSGAVTQIFPNAFHRDNFVRAGGTTEIPGAGARAVVSGALGRERVEIVLTRRSDPLCAPSHLDGEGPFRNVIGGTRALQRDLAVAAASESRGWPARIERRFLTIPASVAAASEFPATTIVIVPSQTNLPPQE
jgi:hypothetical protein